MQAPNYRVTIVRCESGERLPFLIDESGVPVFDPTIFVLTNLRSRNKAANTILNALHAIRLLYVFLNLRKIRLNERLLKRNILDLREIEALAALLRQTSLSCSCVNLSQILPTTGLYNFIAELRRRCCLPDRKVRAGSLTETL